MRAAPLILFALATAGCRIGGGTAGVLKVELFWTDQAQNLDLHVMSNESLMFEEGEYSPCFPTGARSYWQELTGEEGGEQVIFKYGDSNSGVILVHHNGGTAPVPWTDVTLTVDGTAASPEPDTELNVGDGWIFAVPRTDFSAFEYDRTEAFGEHPECTGEGQDSG